MLRAMVVSVIAACWPPPRAAVGLSTDTLLRSQTAGMANWPRENVIPHSHALCRDGSCRLFRSGRGWNV
jgi:hypothetical protein